MKFNIGEKVGLLHDIGFVIVRDYSNGHYTVEDEHGFAHKYAERELVALEGELFPVDEEDIHHKVRSEANDRAQISKKAVRGDEHVWELDLHIEQLVDFHRDMTNTEIIRKQLSVLQLFLNKARRNKVRKAAIIHGVGEGVLKSEILRILSNLDDVQYHDGDYATYGNGATTVEFFYD